MVRRVSVVPGVVPHSVPDHQRCWLTGSLGSGYQPMGVGPLLRVWSDLSGVAGGWSVRLRGPRTLVVTGPQCGADTGYQ
jgi:hypothetical protein